MTYQIKSKLLKCFIYKGIVWFKDSLKNKLTMVSKVAIVLTIFAGIFVEGSLGQVPIGQCTKINACSCVYDEGTIVDLKDLESKTGQPR